MTNKSIRRQRRKRHNPYRHSQGFSNSRKSVRQYRYINERWVK